MNAASKLAFVEILVVEDNPGDVRLIREAFRECGKPTRLHLASDGLEALAFLRRAAAYAHAPRPDLILLDLNLPRLDGREVLVEIKKDRVLKSIPTIILTTSDAEQDVFMSYQEQANCYLRKPPHWDAFDDLMRTISIFWSSSAKLPQQVSAK